MNPRSENHHPLHPLAWTRRAFLARTGGAAGAVATGALAACSSGEDTDAEDDPDVLDPDDRASIRGQFALSPDYSHFDAWVVAANPRMVTEAIDRFRDELDTEPWRTREEAAVRDSSVRRALAELVGGEATEVAMTTGGAQGLGLVFGGVRLGRGDEVLTTEHDGYLVREAVRLAALRTGAAAREVRLYEREAEASTDEIVFRLIGGVSDDTRLVALTWVSPDTGLKLPVAEIADALADVNRDRDEEDQVLLCVDAGYALGVEEVDVRRLGCDFLVADFDHWMFGPRGTGLCWGREAAWKRLVPVLPSLAPEATEAWVAGEEPPDERRGLSGLLATPPGNHDLEHRWAMPAAVRLQDEIGPERIAAWTLNQAEALREGLDGVDGITLITPTDEDLSSALVCFRPEREDPHQMVVLLRRRWIQASLAPFTPRVLRLGPSLITNPDDVDTALSAIRDLA